MFEYFMRGPETKKAIHRLKANDYEARTIAALDNGKILALLYNSFWRDRHLKRSGYIDLVDFFAIGE